MTTEAPALASLEAFYEYAKRTTDFEQKLPPKFRDEVFDLGRVRALLRALGEPQTACPAVHVAGSKGKGSVSAMVAALASGHGLASGCFTSPHLVSIEERIAIDGRPDEAIFLAAASEVIAADRAHRLSPTFFELVFAAAACAFRTTSRQLAVYEVGLGGRLDATNVLSPAVSAITAIDLDHTGLLGPTLAHIAREKAGILKRDTPAVIAPGPLTADEIERAAAVAGAPLIRLGQEIDAVRQPPADGRERFVYRGGALSGDYALGLLGSHQIDNAAVALAIVEQLGLAGVLRPDPGAAAAALASLQLPARIERWGQPTRLVLDCAHTPRSGLALAQALDEHLPGRPLHLVCGMLRDKRVARCISPLSARLASAWAVPVNHTTRGLEPAELVRRLVAADVSARRAASAEAALDAALAAAEADGGVVLIAGSLYLAGELRPRIVERLGEPAIS